MGRTSSAQSLPWDSGAWEMWAKRFPLKTEEKILCLSFLHVSCYQLSCPICQGVCLLFNLPFLDRVLVKGLLNILCIPCHIQFQLCLSISDLVPAHPGTISIFFPVCICPWFHCLCVSFSHFSLTRSLLSYAGLLPFLPDFLHVWNESSWALRNTSLESCQLCSAPLSLRAFSQES